MNLQPLLDKVLEIWNTGLSVIVYSVLFNLVIALAAALKSKTFDLSKLAGFLTDKILPYTVVYIIVRIMGDAIGQAALAPIALTAIEAALAGDLLDSLNTLGLPLPAGLKAIVVKK
jgi:hypothetical protein